jgi:hypothetical protein
LVHQCLRLVPNRTSQTVARCQTVTPGITLARIRPATVFGPVLERALLRLAIC